MSERSRLEELLGRYVRQRVVDGRRLDPESLCEEVPELTETMRECIREYEQLEELLGRPEIEEGTEEQRDLPTFDGFRTIERLGGGGGGEVYKLEDLELGRTVAGKVVRDGGPLRANLGDFLREARSLALFADPRIVTVFEFRSQADPPVLLMEYVDGFELGRIGRSLEYPQRARVMMDVAEAIDHAHRLGIQHRDLKPSNIMLDSRLSPKILDFGVSRGEPDRGHGVGTPDYMAPEQLDPDRPIDARTDVYALGVILYELICGALPFDGRSAEERVRNARSATPRLPVEIEPGVPEPLQAIALKAMERDPVDRYGSARELAAELRRFLEDKPILARPTLYQSALERRLRPHLEQIREWLRIKLIYPHEAERLQRAYLKLQAREDDWIVQSRSLSLSKIALYLGAFLLVIGSLLYFYNYFVESITGLLRPTLVLGLPFVGLNVAAHLLHRRDRQAVAVAFYLGAVLLLPLYLVIGFEEMGLWTVDPADEHELFGEGFTSNRQLQVAILVACLWSGWLALRTRTVALSSCFTALLHVFNLVVLADFGLRAWLEEGEWHQTALHLLPLLLLSVLLGRVMEERREPWLAQPLYYGSIGLFVLIVELLALRGKAFEFIGLSMAPFQSPDVSNPLLLDTLTAMTLNGLLIYATALLLEHYGSRVLSGTAWLLYLISPFAILQPIAWLDGVGEYSRRYDWLYLGLALLITLLSHYRQRRSFYYAGLLNTGGALWLITYHYEWFDRPAWAVVVAAVGLVVLLGGLALHARERARPGPL
jgi:serine/threonine protein kinase